MKITKHHLDRFHNACEKLIHAAGLVHYTRTYTQTDKQKYAGAIFDFENVHVDFQLTNRELNDKQTQIFQSPERMAIHEVAHLVVSELAYMAAEYQYSAANKEEEHAVQRIENMFIQLLTASQIEDLGK
jgi:hypothetical protein